MSAARIVLLSLHATGVALGVLYFALSVMVHDAPDANIGAGLALLWLMVCGSPWSWPLFMHDDLSGDAWVIAILALAALNLVLHAAIPTIYHHLRGPRGVGREPAS